MSEQKEELIKLIERQTEKVVVFHEKNGEVYWVDQPLAAICQHIVATETPNFEYESEESPYGKYINRVFFVKNACAIIHTQWQPAEGYSWKEEKITVLKWETP